MMSEPNFSYVELMRNECSKRNVVRGFLATLFFQIMPFLVFAQWSQSVTIQWLDPVSVTWNGKDILLPTGTQIEIDGSGKPSFFHRQRLKGFFKNPQLTNYLSEPASTVDIDYLKLHQIVVPESPEIKLQVSRERSTYSLVLQLFPYVMENKQVRRISSFMIEAQPSAETWQMEKEFAANSVLRPGSGQWFKLNVSRDGIYKIDKGFLQDCGIDIQTLNPQHINIYGNGDGRLPETNGLPRTDDLAKNAILVFGEGDGTFDDSDYILFYGWGASRWKMQGTQFDQDKNIYSDVGTYFLNINPEEPALRVTEQNGMTLIPDSTITSYSYYDIHENDLVNLVNGGQRWYGEVFDTELERTFAFNIPGILPGTELNFNVAIATNASSSSGTEQRYSLNNVTLSSSPLPTVSSDYIRGTKSFTGLATSSSVPLKISITRNSPSTMVYLDRIVLNTRRPLSFTSSQFNFRDALSVSPSKVHEFSVTSFPSSGFIWDVTNRHKPVKISGQFAGNTYSIRVATDSLREFVASNGINFFSPTFVGAVPQQNLHALPYADMLIVSHSDFMGQAERLANLHRSEGLTVHVVSTEQVFNEFSSGSVDVSAIKYFAKMFHDRALSDSNLMPRYLLLFGDGTFDPKNRVSNNNNYVLTYQVANSENHISALVTDDYFGMLDDGESISPVDLVDIGIGRLLISDVNMAKQQVDKIEHYLKNGSSMFVNSGATCSGALSSSTFGDWRLNYVQIADDEEGGYFVNQDTEEQYDYVRINHPEMNCDKLYTDAYQQVSTAGGQRYPDVYEAITNRVEKGALVVNYVGHGGEVGLAEERIVTVPQIQSWQNIDRLNLFVSATCEFTKYDDPSRVSAGEWVSLNPTGGAIALMTTTRSVFFGVNTITGKRFFENVFTRNANFEPQAFGDIMRLTKNEAGSSDNKRSFTLIGDPALKVALPRLRIVSDSINGLSPALLTDTLRALSKVTIKGHVEDMLGNIVPTFNGILKPTIFDKAKTQYTLGQDPESPVIPFEIQRNVIYKGQATVSNGSFGFSFIVPKDINLSFGPGKISYYGQTTVTDAAGQDQRVTIGGIDPNGVNDAVGPDVQLYMNDENFVSGGITDETPVLLAKLYDENGINTVGNGIGHDLVAILDGNTSDPIILNEYYTADLDSYQSGIIRFPFPSIEAGKHTLRLKVWDVVNNSSETSIDFIVQQKQQIALDHVLNYPNPFTTSTQFFFEHNQVCSHLDVQLQIFTVSGKLVRTINQLVVADGFRSEGIAWDGRDDFGDQLAKGVYVYRLKVRTDGGETAEKTEKLTLLN